ncbi:kinetochore Sim4 complex subunit FTA2-domain-containing protein [Bombardia bombarda]|uniref:Kinetochore Sim4 complex subunit FTA2-domain-containing protein n=1 Tax=Bombardia bombarda TaxID=252184 RepID=A0AA39TI72_9PEZI|nr:kinetochore Sim4 complex subunit FTA2-domain-containing protein [Bombardia bombarda]
MYPDWPATDADLVPLPQCIGPKLEPFDFQGPQQIEFLEYIGEGLHAHVFKIRILGQIYALKLFRFVFSDSWYGPPPYTEFDDAHHEVLSALYNYTEPFSSECRAFGRLQEAGHEDLAVKCFGYMLLSEENEAAMMAQFSKDYFDFNGDMNHAGYGNMRSCYPGKNGRDPPIRGIIKEFGVPDETTPKSFRKTRAPKMLRNIKKMQQLGIIHVDPATRQMINSKWSDFSTAITVPHFLTTPELNPHLTPDEISLMELETFKLSMGDYTEFDEHISTWNEWQEVKLSIRAFHNGEGCQIKYGLRDKAAKRRVYTFVDPRKYDWRQGPVSADSPVRRKLRLKPPVWFYECSSDEQTAKLSDPQKLNPAISWGYKEGFIFPRVGINMWDKSPLTLAHPPSYM